MENLYRICVKIYGTEPTLPAQDADLFVPIFHEWIRDRALDVVALDVADYAHVPDSPGIMLVAHEVSFALDRADGEFGVLAQRRTPFQGHAVDAIEATIRQAMTVAARLQQDRRLAGRLAFDAARLRIEANDRLLVPNSDDGYEAFAPLVQTAVERIFDGLSVTIARITNDPRDRLAVEVRVDTEADLGELAA